MNRRGFLKRGAMAVLGAAAVVALPSIAKPEIPTFNSYAAKPLGIPTYIESDTCMYFGSRRFVVDVDCPDDRIYFLNTRDFVRTPYGFELAQPTEMPRSWMVRGLEHV